MNKPTINELGIDLLKVNTFQKTLLFARPLILVTVFFLSFNHEIYWVLPIITFFLFVSVINLTHDLVHNTLGFNTKTNDLLIYLSGLLIMESGHSYSVTHHLHHNNFPHTTDPEGEPAKKGWLQSILSVLFTCQNCLYGRINTPNQPIIQN